MLCMVGQYHDRLHDRRLEVLDEDSLCESLNKTLIPLPYRWFSVQADWN